MVWRIIVFSLVCGTGIVGTTRLGAQTLDQRAHEITKSDRLEKRSVAVWEEHRVSGTIVYAEMDFHMLASVDIDSLVEVLTDYEGMEERMPRVQEYAWEPVRAGDRSAIFETQRVGITFMGFDGTYSYRQRSETVDLRSQSPRRFVIRYEMTDSLDEKLELSSGEYLLEEVLVDGEAYTYIRQVNLTGIRDDFFGLKLILKRFMPRDVNRLFRIVTDEARERRLRRVAEKR